MKGFQNRTYAEKLRLRIWGLWGLLLALVALSAVCYRRAEVPAARTPGI